LREKRRENNKEIKQRIERKILGKNRCVCDGNKKVELIKKHEIEKCMEGKVFEFLVCVCVFGCVV